MTPVDQVVSARAVVVGSGVAGLSAALGIGDCVVLTVEPEGGGSSRLAQGGVAAPLGPDDDPSNHARDTIAVSGGIGDPLMAELVTSSAPAMIERLVDLGAEFDRTPDGGFRLGREAGHARSRIVHADGDATGPELVRALRTAVSTRPEIEVVEGELVDLIVDENGVAGVLALTRNGTLLTISTPAVVLATGGIGGLYERTTNPPGVTGGGLAAAARAGARLADLEFVQFHPTALATDDNPVPLLTEALRGAGATLIDARGHRFMRNVHPDAELAPRDVVARAVWRRIADGDAVYLDATDAVGNAFPGRFPTVWAHARASGFDPRHQPLPVAPAQHYHMGGIAADGVGRTSLPGLWAVGEVASTGLHGANRLASNSLLEAMVIGANAAQSVRRSRHRPGDSPSIPAGTLDVSRDQPGDVSDQVRHTMWRNVGIERNADGLMTARLSLLRLGQESDVSTTDRNLLLIAGLVTTAALDRTESRGAHYRTDFPQPEPSRSRRSFVDPAPAERRPLPVPLGSSAA